jgi:hypothetical protein
MAARLFSSVGRALNYPGCFSPVCFYPNSDKVGYFNG